MGELLMTFTFANPPEDHSDDLTDEERAAIAAFPQHKIKRIPMGVSALDVDGLSWRDVSRRDAFAKRQRDGASAKSKRIDQCVREMAGRGMSDLEIATELKMTRAAVWQRRTRMGVEAGIHRAREAAK